jgi:hypothetical protein
MIISLKACPAALVYRLHASRNPRIDNIGGSASFSSNEPLYFFQNVEVE